MEIEYKRELEKSYMMIKQPKKDWEDFEIQMFLNNRIEGMLPFYFTVKDEEVTFIYDITGKQSLTTYLRSQGMNSRLLDAFVGSLKKAGSSIQDYLLNENALLIGCDTIFVNHNVDMLYFCYLPGHQQIVNGALSGLMEQLLAQIGSGESELLRQAHGLYQKFLTGEYKVAEESDEAWYEDSNNIQENGRYCYEDNNNLYGDSGCFYGDDSCPYGDDVEIITPEQKQERHCLEEEESGAVPVKEKKHVKNSLSVQKIKEMIQNSFKDFSQKAENGMSLLKEDYFQASYDPECGFVEEEFVYPTVYVGDAAAAVGSGFFKSERNTALGDFDLTAEETLIGKQENGTDVCLCDDTVSRVHAIVQKREDGFYIEDLNSTNGTFVNHEQIPYREQILLHSGDAVAFGRAEFTFYS